MSKSVITTNIPEILGKGLDISKEIQRSAPFEPVAEVLEANRIRNISRKVDTYIKYMELLLETNQKINLTAIKDTKDFIEKHYLDSLSILGEEEYTAAKKIVDLGTGGGFPGVPLAIASPDKSFLLMDSVGKKVNAVSELCLECGIDNVDIGIGRAEEFGQDPEYRENYDLAVSRAVADLSVLSEYCLPLVSVGGAFIAYKNGGTEEEIDRANNAINVLGSRLDRVVSKGEHCLVVIKKISETPDKYPRRTGVPAKRPL